MGYIENRLSAFKYAFSGLGQAFRNETHLKLHGLITLVVVNFGFYCQLGKTEWFMILGCITLVICLELLNSALERLCDRLVPETDPKIKYVKDVAAGAVVVACIFAVIIGLMVFLPHIKNMFQ